MTDAVEEIRAFTRFYTRRIGVLDVGLLGTVHPLPDARVLFELEGPREVRDLRAALGMDAGFLSRVLARLEAAGLILREPSPDDGRRQMASLSRAGESARAELDARSTRANSALLGDLAPAARAELVGALRSVRAALEPGGDIVLRGLQSGDRGWIVARHGALYAQEHGWDARFERLVAQVVADFDPPDRSGAWIAEAGGARAGCVLCVREDERTARLRLLLVEPHARGLGVGGRLVDECLAYARECGYGRVVLWTNNVLTAARRLYDQRGFTLVEEAPHARFGPPVTGQTLALAL